MDMPKPGPEHARYDALAGTWTGDEILHPSPWAPERRSARGRFDMRKDLDGFYLVSDYFDERDGQVLYRGHGIYGYDPRAGRFTMCWFDSMGGGRPSLAEGAWDGDRLVFENESPMGRARYEYRVPSTDRMTFRLSMSKDGASWTTFMEGSYTRA